MPEQVGMNLKNGWDLRSKRKPKTQLEKAREWQEEHGTISVDFLQRKLRINGEAAQRLMDQL